MIPCGGEAWVILEIHCGGAKDGLITECKGPRGGLVSMILLKQQRVFWCFISRVNSSASLSLNSTRCQARSPDGMREIEMSFPWTRAVMHQANTSMHPGLHHWRSKRLLAASSGRTWMAGCWWVLWRMTLCLPMVQDYPKPIVDHETASKAPALRPNESFHVLGG